MQSTVPASVSDVLRLAQLYLIADNAPGSDPMVDAIIKARKDSNGSHGALFALHQVYGVSVFDWLRGGPTQDDMLEMLESAAEHYDRFTLDPI